MTLHRPSNVDVPEVLAGILDALAEIQGRLPILFPEFLNLMANARLVLTDSGGIQEEATILGVPLRLEAFGKVC